MFISCKYDVIENGRNVPDETQTREKVDKKIYCSCGDLW